ncbi:MAG: hypothetical protein ACKVT0_17835 [Planctomycetaceae bacterium]
MLDFYLEILAGTILLAIILHHQNVGSESAGQKNGTNRHETVYR